MPATIAELIADPARSGLQPSRAKDGVLFPLPTRQIASATYQTWLVDVPTQYGFDDLLDPGLWRRIELELRVRAGRPQVGDLLRCIAADGSFDVFLAIRAVDRGYRLQYSHGRLPAERAP